MAPAPTCPPVDTLRLALYGGLPADDGEAVAAHLEACPACAGVAAGLDAAGGLAADAAPAAAPAGSLIDQLKGLWSSDPAPADDDPDRFGPYHVLRPLGRGGMGAVFAAEDLRLGRTVAVKVLARPGRLLADYLHRERTLLAALRHPNIVAVYDSGELADGRPFFVMEFVPGDTLDRAAGGDARRVAGLVRDVAAAVGAAHALGIVHRDLKPQNVKVTPAGEVRVLDFGLARRIESVDTLPPDATVAPGAATGVIGTRGYMSPEQARGEQVDARADVFALGVMLGELLPARRPGDLAAVAAKAAALDPAARYPDAAALAADLSAWLAGHAVAARPGRAYRAGKFARRRWLALAAALLGVGTLAAVVVTDRVRLRAEQGRTEARRAEAVRNYQRARRAVQEYLTEVTSDPDVKGVLRADLRAKLLDKARAFYEEFVAEAGDDPALRADQADALTRLATIATTAGDKERAIDLRARAVGMYEGLLAADPGRVEWRLALAQTRIQLGETEAAVGRITVAATRTPAALAALVGLTGPDADRLAARAYTALGWCHQLTNQKAEAADAHEIALARQRVVAATTGSRDDRYVMSRTLFRLSTVRSGLNQPDAADRHLAECRAIRVVLAREVPKSGSYAYGLGSVYEKLAIRAVRAGDMVTAERYMMTGIEWYDRAVRLSPGVGVHRAYAARSRILFGSALRVWGRAADAEPVLLRAKADLIQLTEDYPGVVRWENDLGLAQYQLGKLYAGTGRPGPALAEVEQARDRLVRLEATGTDLFTVRPSLRSVWGELAKMRAAAGDAAGAAAARKEYDAVKVRIDADKGKPPPPDPDDGP